MTSGTASPTSWFIEALGGGTTASKVRVSPQSAMRCPSVKRAVDLIGSTVGNLPVRLYKLAANEERQPAADHPAFGIAHRSANPWTSARKFRETLTRDAILHGDGFAAVVRVSGKPRELIHLPPGSVAVEIDPVTREPLYNVTIGNAMNAVVATVQAAVNKVVGAVNSITSAVNAGGAKLGIDVGLGALPKVDLGQIANRYEGAGKAAGEGYGRAFRALSLDYVGSAIDAGAKGLEALRSKANLAAAGRIMNSPITGKLDNGSLDAKLKAPKTDADGKGGGADKEDALEREITAIQKRARAYDSERESLGKSAAEAAKAEATFRLLEAAKKGNITVTDELRGKIDTLATAYASAKVKLDEAKAAQQRAQEQQRYLGDAMTDAVTDLALEGRSLTDVFDNLAKSLAKAAIQAALMGSGPLGGIFGMGAPAGGGIGGLFGALLGFADGGHVRGPGTSTSDSIPAKLSDGEFVTNARATAKNRPLLEALNDGTVTQDDLVPAPVAVRPEAAAAPLLDPRDLARAFEAGLITVPDLEALAAPDAPRTRAPDTRERATQRITAAIVARPPKAPRLPAFKTGGHVRGPGTGTSDSITAKLSTGEFVVRAAAVAKHRNLLERINRGDQMSLPAFATGGLVGTAPAIPSPTMGSTGMAAPSISINAPVTITSAAGTPAQNAELAAQTAGAFKNAINDIIDRRLRAHLRPGAMMNQ